MECEEHRVLFEVVYASMARIWVRIEQGSRKVFLGRGSAAPQLGT